MSDRAPTEAELEQATVRVTDHLERVVGFPRDVAEAMAPKLVKLSQDMAAWLRETKSA